jgi:hypothetical protein
VPDEQWGAGFALDNDDDTQPRLYFQRVPEAEAAKNRVATTTELGVHRALLRDPEGNEFCA